MPVSRVGGGAQRTHADASVQRTRCNQRLASVRIPPTIAITPPITTTMGPIPKRSSNPRLK
jgi:hypothetical protein